MTENKFEVIYDEEVTGKYVVKESETGWFYPNLTEMEAETLAEKLNEVSKDNAINGTLYDDFMEYNDLIVWLNKTNRRLTEISEIYTAESKLILSDAIANGFDFKAHYGGNTEKTRKQYCDEQLAELLDEKKELKFCKEDDLRRIEFLKRLINAKIELIKYDKGEEL